MRLDGEGCDMRTLMRKKANPARPDPAPSRWSWRMQRLMLTPGFRLALRAGLPFCVTLMAGTLYLSDEGRRNAITLAVAEARASIEERPEFMVKLMAIDGAEPALSAEIRQVVPIEFPQSSFDLDLAGLRTLITDLDGVMKANVRIKPGGVLQVDVTPRIPVALWRSEDGLKLVDINGIFVAPAETRAAHSNLPIIAGEGADSHVSQALRLLRAASVLEARVRGIVRMGDRRWDVVLDRDQRIMLPEINAQQALERVIALEGAQEILTRDVVRVDMRLPSRPTVRMSAYATQELWDIRQVSGQ
jgi:cell division protein FtsQ